MKEKEKTKNTGYWICVKNDCGHFIAAKEKPEPLKWDDGHICYFRPAELEEAI